MSAEEELVEELVRLRHGWALQRRFLHDRIGPQLVRLCGIADTDNDREIRGKLRSWLTTVSAEIPADLRRALALAFALDPHHQSRQLAMRVERLAREQSCAPRTARRRIDHAVRLISHAAAGRTVDVADPESGWHVRSMRAELDLDRAGAELRETRLLVADRAGLRRIAVRLSAPPPAASSDGIGEVLVEALSGARVVSTEKWVAAQHFRFDLELTESLQVGDEHEVGLRYLLPPGREIRPHYALLPLVPCEHFALSIKFRADSPPKDMWRLDGAPPRLVDDEQSDDQRLRIERKDDVRLVFTDLRQGRAYGLAWRV